MNLKDYGATLNGSGVGDSDALERAVTEGRASTLPLSIRFRGDLTLTRSPPNLDRVHITGIDMTGSTILKMYPGTTLIRYEGRPGYTGGGLHNLSIPLTPYTAGSYLILCRAHDRAYSCDGIQLEHLYIGSGRPEWAPWRCLEIDGSQKVTPPEGIRLPWIQDVTCFGSSAPGSVYIAGTVGLIAVGLHCYPGTAPYGSIVWGPRNVNQTVIGQ